MNVPKGRAVTTIVLVIATMMVFCLTGLMLVAIVGAGMVGVA